jgi:AAA+ superfamily predicted ATPase
MDDGETWTHVLRRQLTTLVREAWLDYQSNPGWWTTADRETGPSSHRDEFTRDLCRPVGLLLCSMLYPGLVRSGNSAAEAVLDGLSGAFGSIPDYSKSQAKSMLVGHLASLQEWAEEWAEEFGLDRRPLYVPGELYVLLTSSSLRDGYLRPLFSMVVVSLAALDERSRSACHGALKEFVAYCSNDLKVLRLHLAELVEEVFNALSTMNFAKHIPSDTGNPIAQIARAAHFAISSFYDGTSEETTAAASGVSRQGDDAATEEINGNVDQVLSELTEMVGLDAVKKEIVSIANFIKVRQLREARGLPNRPISLHLVFAGSPGTGKTTVARVVARLYKSLGVLSKGHLVEVDRSGLVSQYVGGTALKTKEAVESALDGVLFIDEAYSLHKETTWGDVGLEAIETLLKLMEDNRGRFVVIVAGYTDKMADFIASNPGLESRFTRHVEFEDYTADEMLRIFVRNAIDNGFEVDPAAADALLNYFGGVEGDDGFGNGRGVRNVLEAAIVCHANRVAAIGEPSHRDLTLLMREDVKVDRDRNSDEPEPHRTIIEGEMFTSIGPYSVGDRIVHLKFGEGTIVSREGSKLIVAFDKAGQKRVVDSFVERV